MKKIIIAIISLLVLSVPAFGSDWKQFGADKDKTYYLDVDSIARKNKTVKYWSKIEFNIPGKDTSGKLRVQQQFNEEMNCSKRTVKPLSSIRYYSDGSSQSRNFKAEPIAIPPGSIIDVLSKILCK